MKDLRLTQTANGGLDLLMENGSFQWAEEGEQVAQHGSLRLMIIKGERQLDITDGTDFYGIIFDQQKSKLEKELELRRRITTTPDVLKIISLDWNQTGHVLYFDIHIQTAWGAETVSTEFSLL